MGTNLGPAVESGLPPSPSKPSLSSTEAAEAGRFSLACSTEPVMLDVGGRHFATTIGTLVDRSEFFAAFFSGRWSVPKQEDGTVFLDADGHLFAHILRYLRRGLFPLAFDNEHGHDLYLYNDLLVEARYLQIPKLQRWLEAECYNHCVQRESVCKRPNDPKGAHNRWPAIPGSQLLMLGPPPATVQPSSGQTLRPSVSARTPPSPLARRRLGDRSQGAKMDILGGQWAEYGKQSVLCKGWLSDEGNDFQKHWQEFIDSNRGVPDSS
ncbi:hypothetical protein B0T24DRAFT_201982 [Lasiosphaeria ovina]|uniref:BTB domain-containing protein n=1 Tax=Lasiosphaeria ovina TaxID=92902 RepID=A0AAE0N9B0_9PEZI|nr:hypothetical protein B0T24DRAFT_201982 [Lasiosphaeria ovina]